MAQYTQRKHGMSSMKRPFISRVLSQRKRTKLDKDQDSNALFRLKKEGNETRVQDEELTRDLSCEWLGIRREPFLLDES